MARTGALNSARTSEAMRLITEPGRRMRDTHRKMQSGADQRGGSPLVSFNHVTDPHFVTFSSSLYTTIRNPNQWRRKQFASGGTMPARSAGRNFFDVPPHFSLVPPPHMRGHNDCLLPTERQWAIKVMGPSTYSYTHTRSISSAPITYCRKAMGALQVK